MIPAKRLAEIRASAGSQWTIGAMTSAELIELVTAYEAAREFVEHDYTNRTITYNRLIACFREPTK